MHVYIYVGARRGCQISWSGVEGSWVLPDMGAGNRTHVSSAWSTLYHWTLTPVPQIQILRHSIGWTSSPDPVLLGSTSSVIKKRETNDFPMTPKRNLPPVLQLSNEITNMANFYSPSRIALSRFFFMLVYWGTGSQLITCLVKFVHFPRSLQCLCHRKHFVFSLVLQGIWSSFHKLRQTHW